MVDVINELMINGLTVRVTLLVAPAYVPEIETGVGESTGIVVSPNDAIEDPAATVTVSSVVAAALLVARLTTMPPSGAGPVKVTNPVTCDCPPTVLLGLSVIFERATGRADKFAVLVEPW